MFLRDFFTPEIGTDVGLETDMTTNTRTFIGAAAGLAAGAVLTLWGPSVLSAENARPNASNTVVTCQPSERVVVHHSVVNNELQVATECVPAVGLTTARFENAVLTDDSIRTVAPTRTVAPRTVARTSSARRSSTQRVEKKHDWAKTAMIIGGSAGAGAGIGGIAKGKQGALIGAAIGGGAAAIVEAIRR